MHSQFNCCALVPHMEVAQLLEDVDETVTLTKYLSANQPLSLLSTLTADQRYTGIIIVN